MIRIFIVNGKPESGKDTFVDYMILNMLQDNKIARKLSTITTVKKAATLLGWNGVKDAKGRDFLSALKDLSTSFYNNPFNEIRRTIDSCSSSNIFFIMIREPEEIAKVVAAYPAITRTILISRVQQEAVKHSNHADQRVHEYNYNHLIGNIGTLEDFQRLTRYFYDSIKEEL